MVNITHLLSMVSRQKLANLLLVPSGLIALPAVL
jgi:hypothetical protein